MRNQVTIAVPVYNGEKYVIETLQSILDQTVKIDHVIICDNHSTDNTVITVKKFISENKDVDIKLFVNSENIGGFRNFNRCMELCTSDYLLLLGADDTLKPEAIEKQLGVFDEYPDLALIGGITDFIYDGKLVLNNNTSEIIIFNKGQIVEFIKKTNLYMQHSTILFNYKLTKQIGLWEIKIGADERFNARVLKHYPIAFFGKPLVNQRIHLKQETNSENLRFHDKIEHFEENYKMASLETTPKRVKKAQRLLNDWIACQCIGVGKSVWKKFGKKKLAIEYWLYGLRRNPFFYLKRYTIFQVEKYSKKAKRFITRTLN